ncbi:MAG TPA: MBL fold metallo-hydrolase [Spirochaetota bacterium]|nr:MBL fold metallo-hydrolase [Spirochaetota bacterium]HNT10494.1 MBL fold metallo-hydrolase [Spirochaetota bacterium]HNV48610.1 MBL fold metallo-hydrolase [Spirochaetota bacterium]HPU90142.1 MBL fold metallo-hydrolase [Spirochaetota bacterium]
MDTLEKEILPGIFIITQKGRWGVVRPAVNLYFIAGPDGLLFDAGYGNRSSVRMVTRGIERVVSRCTGRGEPCVLTRVLPSHAHPDHFAGLKKIRRSTGARVLLTETMAGIISSRSAYRRSYRFSASRYYREKRPMRQKLIDALVNPLISFLYELVFGTAFISNPDEIVPDSGSLTVNGEQWTIVPSPGHSADHIALYSESRGVLLAGDNVLRRIITWLGPPKSDLAAYFATLERYRALPRLDVILSAHGSPVRNPQRRIDEIVKWRTKRIADVQRAVDRSGAEGIGFTGIIDAFYRRKSLAKRFLAEGWVMLTLDYLVTEGAIERFAVNGRVRFRSTAYAPDKQLHTT